MVNGLFKSVSSNQQLSDSAKCILVACVFMLSVMIASTCLAIPFLAFAACFYVGWNLSWKLVVAVLSRTKGKLK